MQYALHLGDDVPWTNARLRGEQEQWLPLSFFLPLLKIITRPADPFTIFSTRPRHSISYSKASSHSTVWLIHGHSTPWVRVPVV